MAERTFPQKAKRGEMKAFQYPYMKISDKVSEKTFHKIGRASCRERV